jgi:hypothetical protein
MKGRRKMFSKIIQNNVHTLYTAVTVLSVQNFLLITQT